jgi:hypothetical protein
VKLGWYESIESLLSHYEDWIKAKRGTKKGTTFDKAGRFYIVDSVDDYIQASRQAIRLSVPMDETFLCFE